MKFSLKFLVLFCACIAVTACRNSDNPSKNDPGRDSLAPGRSSEEFPSSEKPIKKPSNNLPKRDKDREEKQERSAILDSLKPVKT